MQAKWIDAFLNLLKGRKANCPHCGSSKLDYGYVLFEKGQSVGYGAFWCEDCKHAFNLSRANIKNNKKVLPKLPEELIYA